MPSELTVNEDHPDKVLARKIASGEVTKQEVERVWDATAYLSAQTPFEVRKAIVDLKAAGIEISGGDQIVLSAVLDLRAALYRDESKFAHLVAGTETVVAALQKLNPLQRHLDRQEALISSLTETIERLEEKVEELVEAQKPKEDVVGEVPVYDPERPLAPDESPEQAVPEENIDQCIGSSWDPNNPRKGPLPPFPASETAKEAEARTTAQQSAQFREEVIKKL